MLGLRLDTGLPFADAGESLDQAALGRLERLGLADSPCRRRRARRPWS